jgi:AraC-like DNA-binding protein
MAILTRGIHYFGKNGFPVAVRIVNTEPEGKPSHHCDVTEIEHYHDFTELVIVSSGRGRHLLAGESFPVIAGDVFVLQGRQVHCFREREKLRLLNVMYDPARLMLPTRLLRRIAGYSALFMLEPAFRRAHRFSSRLHLNRSDLGAAGSIVHRIEEESASRSEGYETVLLSLLVQLMVFVSRRYGENKATEARALLRVGQLISTLEQNFTQPWTVDQMARFVHLSRSSLMRTFRQATAQAPIDYLISLRIEVAMRLLQQTGKSMTDIALDSGFADSNYFARQFRRVCGCTPSDFRKRTGH